jgi:hypothetical protein
MKVIIYTCNTNGYDRRKIAPNFDSNTQYLYYSDDMSMLDGWRIMPVDKTVHENNSKICRYYKINSHLLPRHEYSIWIDASFQLKNLDVVAYINKNLGKADMACYFHNTDQKERSCIYKEAAVNIANESNNIEVILDQITKYKNEGYPIYNGLYATGILIRRNTAKIREFNKIWWDEVKKYSHRDQISQMYAIWKSNIKVNKITKHNVYNNLLVKFYYHKHRQEELKKRRNNRRLKG